MAESDPPIEYRRVRAHEFDEYVALDAYAFGYRPTPERVELNRRTVPLETMRGAFCDGRMLAHLCILPMRMWLNGGPVPMGGIADVAAWPEARRRGLTGGLLRRALVEMREAGQPLSMLNPTFYPLYQRFGYARAATSVRLSASAPALRPPIAGQDATGVRRAAAAEWPTLAALYGASLGRANGEIERDAMWWQNLGFYAGDGAAHAAVFEDAAGLPSGYLRYGLGSVASASAERQQMHVRELVARTPRARSALLAYLASHDLVDPCVWDVAEDDPTWACAADPDAIRATAKPGFMLRVVDLPSALEQRPCLDSGPIRFTVDLRDESAPWNAGRWIVEREAGVTSVCRSEREPDASLDAGTLAQLYNGFLSPEGAHAGGALALRDSASDGIAALARFFAVTRRPFCSTYF